MSDFLLELGKHPQARKLIKNLGLPIPVPQTLSREDQPYQQRPLADQDVVLSLHADSPLCETLASCLAEAGANPHLVGTQAVLSSFHAAGEAFGRPPKLLDLQRIPGDFRPRALLLDATTLQRPEDLHQLYDFFHTLVTSLPSNGRAIVLGRPPASQNQIAHAATQAALEGFVRSLAKELGRRGSTAQLVSVAQGAENRLPALLRFLLSPRSAYISGQPFLLSNTTKAPEAPSPWTFPLEGKTALVTGAARGIGAATARRLAQEGARVVCLDIPSADGPTSKLARQIDGLVLSLDITEEEAPATISDFLQQECGGVDIVVHNAGVTRDKTLARMRPHLWEQAIDVNLSAVSRITQTLLEGTMHPNGRIVCLSSIAGIAGNVGQTNYAASKAGIIGFVKRLAELVAPRGITANAVAPGFIETRLTDAMPMAIREVARRMNNLGQGGQPLDVAETITFLATPNAVGLTGQIIRVCGGSLVGA